MMTHDPPYICPDHPDAQIRHSWDQKHCVFNGYPAGTGWQTNHTFECANCGRELAAKPITVKEAG